jgi:hypothetical protein
VITEKEIDVEKETTAVPSNDFWSRQAGGGIHKAIVAVMGEIGGIGKGRKSGQGYSFRGIADASLAAQPLMAKHGRFVTPHRVVMNELHDRETKHGGYQAHVRMSVEFRFYHLDGSYVSCTTTGEAMDTGDKASNKAMSAALKYALFQTFCIPEEDPKADTEADEPEPTATRKGPKSSPKDAPASAKPTPSPTASAPAASAPSDDPANETGEHPAVEMTKKVFKLDPKGRESELKRKEAATNLLKLACHPGPVGHGWPSKKFENLLKKYFKTPATYGLDMQQISDAQDLVVAYAAGPDIYRAKVAELQEAGRIAKEEAKAS